MDFIILSLSLFAFWWILCKIAARAGWQQLAAKFAARSKPHGKRHRPQKITIGRVTSNGITIFSSKEGLYFKVGLMFRLAHPPVFVPWNEIHPLTVELLYGDMVALDVGSPSVATMQIPENSWATLIKDRPPDRDRAAFREPVNPGSASASIAARSSLPPPPALKPSELPSYFSYRQSEWLKGWLIRITAPWLLILPFAFLFVGLWHVKEQTLGFYVAGIAVVLSALTMLPFVYLMNLASRMCAPSARDVLAKDSRAPVLFLRSFDEESLDVTGFVYEEEIVTALEQIGPAVAIGRPGEPRPALGAARFYVDDRHWQDAVRFILNRASAVVLQVAGSDGVAWEISLALGSLRPESLLFYFPLAGPEDDNFIVRRLRGKYPDIAFTLAGRISTNAPGIDAARALYARKEQRWESFVARSGPLIPAPLPAKLGDASFLCFEPDWTPMLLKIGATRADSQNGSAVSEAIAPFRNRLTEAWGVRPEKKPSGAGTLVSFLFLLAFGMALIVAETIFSWMTGN